MSFEVNTYEEMKINNVNEKTASIAFQVGEYLIKTWGINSIRLIADGEEFCETDVSSISEGSDLHKVCEKLGSYKNISLTLSSTNNGMGPGWRMLNTFMKNLSDDEEIKANVIYKSIDYYDTDSCVEMYLYDENGLRQPEYSESFESIADIEYWYCYTPEIYIGSDETDNTELHDRIIDILKQAIDEAGAWDSDSFIDDIFEDYGEIIGSGSLSFSTESIAKIAGLFQNLVDEIKKSETTELRLTIEAVPCGEDEYKFASVLIYIKDEKVRVSYCRF